MHEARAIDERTLTEELTDNRFECLRARFTDQPLHSIPAGVISIPSLIRELNVGSTIQTHRPLKTIADLAYQELHHCWTEIRPAPNPYPDSDIDKDETNVVDV